MTDNTNPAPSPTGAEMLRAIFRLLIIAAVTGILAAALLLSFLAAEPAALYQAPPSAPPLLWKSPA